MLLLHCTPSSPPCCTSRRRRLPHTATMLLLHCTSRRRRLPHTATKPLHFAPSSPLSHHATTRLRAVFVFPTQPPCHYATTALRAVLVFPTLLPSHYTSRRLPHLATSRRLAHLATLRRRPHYTTLCSTTVPTPPLNYFTLIGALKEFIPPLRPLRALCSSKRFAPRRSRGSGGINYYRVNSRFGEDSKRKGGERCHSHAEAIE